MLICSMPKIYVTLPSLNASEFLDLNYVRQPFNTCCLSAIGIAGGR